METLSASSPSTRQLALSCTDHVSTRHLRFRSMPTAGSSKRQSAGILLFRRGGGTLQVLLGHPGGPFWRRRDRGAWTIPKGLVSDGETLLSAARREFAEETGHAVTAEVIELGKASQPSGKVVHVWAASDDWDLADFRSNTFEMEWPPRSGRQQRFPEIDRVDWFEIAEARSKILKGQTIFLDRLLERLGGVDGSKRMACRFRCPRSY